jgi:branched-chain amino acid transport system substrate-binding protein
MKKLVLALAATTFMSTAALAEDIKIGVFLGFTGPIESTVANMGPGAELAIKEVSDSGALLDGIKVEAVRGDTTCIDAAAATAAAERLITTDKVKAMVGGDCSGVTGAALQNVARAERHRDDLAVRHLAGSVHGRRRWPVFPYRPVGCPPG